MMLFGSTGSIQLWRHVVHVTSGISQKRSALASHPHLQQVNLAATVHPERRGSVVHIVANGPPSKSALENHELSTLVLACFDRSLVGGGVLGYAVAGSRDSDLAGGASGARVFFVFEVLSVVVLVVAVFCDTTKHIVTKFVAIEALALTAS